MTTVEGKEAGEVERGPLYCVISRQNRSKRIMMIAHAPWSHASCAFLPTPFSPSFSSRTGLVR